MCCTEWPRECSQAFILNRLGVPLNVGVSGILFDPSSICRGICGRACLRRLLSRFIASCHTSVSMHTAMTIGLTSYRSEALGHKALWLMVRIRLLCIEIIDLIIYSVGYTDSGPNDHH